MAMSQQLKVGPELLNPSRESWIAYYIFAVLTLGTLGGGWLWLKSSGYTGADYTLALIGILILSAVFGGVTIMCHLLGHLIDEIDELKREGGRPRMKDEG
ncbi:hypothetical protein BH09SUM1_BH09SUM1_14200 [soil metagenome]